MEYRLKDDEDKKSLFDSDLDILPNDFIRTEIDWGNGPENCLFKVIRREFILEDAKIKETLLHYERITNDYDLED